MKIERPLSISSDDSLPYTTNTARCSTKSTSLFNYAQEQCEFCDKTFNNKYDLFVHNVSHIIIPLLNQEHYQCSDCLVYFTSREKLKQHKNIKHPLNNFVPSCVVKLDPVLLKAETSPIYNIEETSQNTLSKCTRDKSQKIPSILLKKEPVTKCDDLEPTALRVSSILEELLKREPVIKCNDLRLSNSLKLPSGLDVLYRREQVIKSDNSEITTAPKVSNFLEDLLKKEPVIKCNDLKVSTAPNKVPSGLEVSIKKEPIMKCDDLGSSTAPSLKNRIIFEGDFLVDDNIFEELTTDLSNNLSEESLEKQLKIRESTALDLQEKCVHYDDLVKPDRLYCKWCNMFFPDRFQLIKHETDHLFIRPKRLPLLCPNCDRFIAGNHTNLNMHVKRYHEDKKRQGFRQKCKQCGLMYYSYKKHVRNYHYIHKCVVCGKGFEVEKERDIHTKDCKDISGYWENRVAEKWSTKKLKLCELCFAFCKNSSRMNYVCIKDINDDVSKHVCKRCGYKFFCIKLVEFKSKVYFKEKLTKRPLSNEDRLLNIQKRMKMLNNRNKY